jgi:ubiquinone/menaquinone biosynthesis C-methylase UbiE
MIEYARVQAEAEQVDNRVEFRVMDALRVLEFPAGYFDLVNQRSATGFLRTWDWPTLLGELQRVTCPGGVIRIAEADFGVVSTSPALTRLNQLGLDAFYRAGHVFHHERKGVTSELARLMEQQGVQDVQTRASTLEYRASTAEGQHFYEDMKMVFRTVVPFLRKWISVPYDYEDIYQQALSEMKQPDFVATWEILTAWGTRR